MDDFDWIDTSSEGRLHSAIYKCTECSKKVAYGDNFCRHCGIRFTPAMCAHMKKDLKILGKDNFWHLALIMLVVLVIILGTVLS